MTVVTQLVSILIPCFNAERWVAETLDSALGQTWPNIEIIVVDDGSTDGSAVIVESYADRGVRLIRRPNRGPSAARNSAFSACRGEFIQYLDADDLLEPGKIESQIERLIEQPDCIALGVTGWFNNATAEAGFPSEECCRDFDPFELLLGYQPGGSHNPPSWLVPRSIADLAGPWDERLNRGEDLEYFVRIVLASRRVLFCPGAKWTYRFGNPDSLSHSPDPGSLFLAFELAADSMIAGADSEHVRRYWALKIQNLARWAYPRCPGLSERALRHAAGLHPVKFDPGGGPRFRLVSRLIGWRAARRLQFGVFGR